MNIVPFQGFSVIPCLLMQYLGTALFVGLLDVFIREHTSCASVQPDTCTQLKCRMESSNLENV